MPKATEIKLADEMILDVTDTCSGQGRGSWVRVVKSPIKPHSKTTGYGSIPVGLLDIPWYSGLRVKVTVEVIGVDETQLPTPNPFYAKDHGGTGANDYPYVREQRAKDKAMVATCKKEAKKIKAQLAIKKKGV